jgi:hypothetical protein
VAQYENDTLKKKEAALLALFTKTAILGISAFFPVVLGN